MPSGSIAGSGVNRGGGALRLRVTFAAPDSVEDEFGNVSTGWVDRFTVSANITPRLGGEAIEAARLAGTQPVVIRVRKSPDTVQIRTDWKATGQDGVIYNIRTAIDPFLGLDQHGFYIDMSGGKAVAASDPSRAVSRKPWLGIGCAPPAGGRAHRRRRC